MSLICNFHFVFKIISDVKMNSTLPQPYIIRIFCFDDFAIKMDALYRCMVANEYCNSASDGKNMRLRKLQYIINVY